MTYCCVIPTAKLQGNIMDISPTYNSSATSVPYHAHPPRYYRQYNTTVSSNTELNKRVVRSNTTKDLPNTHRRSTAETAMNPIGQTFPVIHIHLGGNSEQKLWWRLSNVYSILTCCLSRIIGEADNVPTAANQSSRHPMVFILAHTRGTLCVTTVERRLMCSC